MKVTVGDRGRLHIELEDKRECEGFYLVLASFYTNMEMRPRVEQERPGMVRKVMDLMDVLKRRIM